MGVLQRISLSYLILSFSYLFLNPFWLHFIFIPSCLAVYIGLMHGYPVPPFDANNLCGRGVLTPACNFGAYVDQHVFGKKYMIWPNDPEGLFTTLTSLVNTFAGLCFSLLMRRNSQKKGSNNDLVKYWLYFTLILVTIGGLLTIFEPVNKKRWSASFAFYTSALSGGALCLCFYLVDILNKPFIKEKICLPFLWLGMNPLFIFVAMICFDNLLMNNIKFHDSNGKLWNVWGWINEKLFASWMGDLYLASVTVSILNLALWMLVAYVLYRKKIFIKL